MTGLEEGLEAVTAFVRLGKELAGLKELLLPQYRDAAADLYKVSRLILDANRTTAGWLSRFRHLDFRAPGAHGQFLNTLIEFDQFLAGNGAQEMKFSCSDIDLIYRKHIKGSLSGWFGLGSRKEKRVADIFARLSDADDEIGEFIDTVVLPALKDFRRDVGGAVNAADLDRAEQIRLEFVSGTEPLAETLERFAGQLSDLVRAFARLANVPVTLSPRP
jgi:hypothetical protein